MLGSSGVQRHHADAPSGSAGVQNDVWLSMSQTLRARVLSVAVALVGEVGYARMTVKRVARVSGISQQTFYECFEDLDDCLLAAFEDALSRVAAVVIPAYEAEREWPAKVRAAVAALLAAMEDEPALGTFLFVGALGAGPKVLACRMQALERLKIAFEDGIDEAGGVAGSVVAECSPLSAEGTVNGVLGILHTRLLAGSPLARRPLGELAGPLTAMIVLPYAGRATAWKQLPTRPAQRRPSSRALPKAGPRKAKRRRLTAKQRAILKALKDGPLTVRELVDATGMSEQTVRNVLRCLVEGEKVMKTNRDDRVAYDLPSKGDARAGQRDGAAASDLDAGSSPSPEISRVATAAGAASNGAGSATSNGTGAPAAAGASNGAAGPSSNGTATSNGHHRSVPTMAELRALDTPLSKRELGVLGAIGELNAQGSSPSNREIGNATQIYDPTQLSKLIQRLARRGLVEHTGAARLTGKPYAWRLTPQGTEMLHELEGQTVGA
jgi:AcrR family transcriptional regulator/DNA-binding MarR family transcriptional regulator